MIEATFSMEHAPNLEHLYLKFLGSKLDSEIGKELSAVLNQVGLYDESRLLASYCELGSHAIPSVQLGAVGECRCFVGANPPADADSGDIWFDVVELVLMILLPGARESPDADMRDWIAVHPVYVWQFRTFLRSAEWRIIKEYFMNVTDLMNLDRFESVNSMDYITNVYHEEAVAYAHWFGKHLAGQFSLEKAKEFLTPTQFSIAIPVNLRLWDGSEYPSSEFVRIAVGQDTIDKDPDDEFELREMGKNKSLSNQMLFEEWERSVNIGFSVAVPLQIGMIKNIPRLCYEFMELHNAAPRP